MSKLAAREAKMVERAMNVDPVKYNQTSVKDFFQGGKADDDTRDRLVAAGYGEQQPTSGTGEVAVDAEGNLVTPSTAEPPATSKYTFVQYDPDQVDGLPAPPLAAVNCNLIEEKEVLIDVEREAWDEGTDAKWKAYQALRAERKKFYAEQKELAKHRERLRIRHDDESPEAGTKGEFTKSDPLKGESLVKQEGAAAQPGHDGLSEEGRKALLENYANYRQRQNDRWKQKINSYFAKKKSAVIQAYAEYRDELSRCEQKFLERLPDSDPVRVRDRIEAIAGKQEPDNDAADWLEAIEEVHGYEPNEELVAALISGEQFIENPADGDAVEIYAEAEKFVNGPLPSAIDQRNLRPKDKVFVETEIAPQNSDAEDGEFDVAEEAGAVERLKRVVKVERETSTHEAEPGEEY
jgi:hypothetical protein